MDKQTELIRLREALAGRDGEVILAGCRRFMVETACRANAPAEWVKGMGLLIGRLERVDEECRIKYEKRKEP